MYLLWNSENPEYVYLSAWKRFLPTCNRESKKIIASKQQRGFDTNQMFQVEWKHCMPRVDKSPRHMEDWKRNLKKKITYTTKLRYALGLESSFSKQPSFLSGNLAEYIKLVSNRLYTSLSIDLLLCVTL